MKYRRLLSAVPLMLLSSCMAQMDKGGGTRTRLGCIEFNKHVYTGTMSHNGTPLATVTVDFRDTSPPGFKHNVLVVQPPGSNPPATPQYDAECDDGPPLVFNILTPTLGVKITAWQVSKAQQQGNAFHVTDTKSILFPEGADGDFQQTQ